MAAATVAVDYSFPEGFLHSAKCFISLTGLDIKNNAVHLTIWDLFKAARRGDRKPIHYKSVSADHLYPKRKQVVVNEDIPHATPSPSGILKLNWLDKHMYEVPAVVVFFFDLEWTHPQWDDKVIECASKIKVIRSSLNGHDTEICVALIQSVKPNPAGTDQSVSDKAAQLCSACELPAPNLFVMPYVDRPEGYVNRLESTFYELALRYYAHQSKKIKVAKDGNKYLAVRRMFKQSYYTEMKQDLKEALKHYIATYKYLTDIMTLNEHRIMEYKMIAGFVNYKICKLFFDLDDPRNAISQHQKFLETFRKEKGPKELLFQHLEWIANQYSAFADLFAEAVRKNLKPTQVQHPGIHYHQAVLHELERRRLKESLCRVAYDSLPHPLPHPFTELPAVEFIGERPWRVGLSDSQPSSYKLKEKAVTIIQAHEYTIETTKKITVLLSNALHHFKELNFHSEHMINHLKTLLGEEYFVSEDYEKCLALLHVSVVNYRKKRWWKLLHHVLDIMLRCSYKQGLAIVYVSVCLELISKFIPNLLKDKLRIQENLDLVLKGEVPSPEFGSNQSGTESEKWNETFSKLRNHVQVDNVIRMSDLASCVECKAWFTEHSFTSDSLVRLEIYLRSNAPLPISFTSVKVTFDHEESNQWCTLNEPIELEPGKFKQIVFEFPTTSETLQVLTVEALLGSFVLVWVEGVSQYGLESSDWAWNRIGIRTSTLILQRESLISLEIKHSPPILLTEIYPITVSITNNEERDIKDILMLAVLLQHHESGTPPKDSAPGIRLYSEYPSPAPFPLPPMSPKVDSHYCIEASFPLVRPGEKFEVTFYAKSYAIGSHKLNINCSYNVDCFVSDKYDLVTCKCDKEEIVSINTITPLRVSHRILNMQFHPIDCVFYNDPFLVQTTITCQSPWNVQISDTKYQLKDFVTMDTGPAGHPPSMVLSANDASSEVHCVSVCAPVPGLSHDSHMQLGAFSMKWKRAESAERIDPADVSVNLPNVYVKTLPYSLTVDVAAYAILNRVLTITYQIHNRTLFVQSFDSLLPSSNDFVFTGNRITTFRVLPESTHSISFNLLPLNVGYVPLPKLEVTCTTQPKLDEQLMRGITSTIPQSIYVMPSSIGADPSYLNINNFNIAGATTAETSLTS